MRALKPPKTPKKAKTAGFCVNWDFYQMRLKTRVAVGLVPQEGMGRAGRRELRLDQALLEAF